ncbi:hypothetical protein [Corynebacterium hadale]|uniref:hypothetical protein n=1 Tax=Corynebacterium hadale TaxID=2026255 RepID=UPI0013FDE36C|nr:hypothetical protein [Corynebacterium hadale]
MTEVGARNTGDAGYVAVTVDYADNSTIGVSLNVAVDLHLADLTAHKELGPL